MGKTFFHCGQLVAYSRTKWAVSEFSPLSFRSRQSWQFSLPAPRCRFSPWARWGWPSQLPWQWRGIQTCSGVFSYHWRKCDRCRRAAAGLGGFFPPLLLGAIKQQTGSFTLGFVALSAFSLGCLVVLLLTQRNKAMVPKHQHEAHRADIAAFSTYDCLL